MGRSMGENRIVNAFFEPDAGVLGYGAAKAAWLNLTQDAGCRRSRVASGSQP